MSLPPLTKASSAKSLKKLPTLGAKPSIQQQKNLLQGIEDTEKLHPVGNCSYCLTRRICLVGLPCQHSFCAHCCLQIVKVSKIKKGLSTLTELIDDEEPLKCPQCGVVHVVTAEDKRMYTEVMGVEELKQRIKKRTDVRSQQIINRAENSMGKPMVLLTQMQQLCQLCVPSTTKLQAKASFQCLTCQSTLMCHSCQATHTKHPRRQNHQVVPFEQSDDLLKIENLVCDAHQMNFSLYCFQDEMPLCLGCNSLEAAAADAALQEDETKQHPKKLRAAHEGHFVKSIKEVLRQAQKDKQKLFLQIQEQENKLTAALTYFSGLQEIFVEQRDLFLKKLNADCEVLQRIVEKRRQVLTCKIKECYDSQIQKTFTFKEGLTALYQILSKVKGAEVRVDLDQVNLNRAMEFRVKEIEQEMDLQLNSNQLDLIHSKFTHDPVAKVTFHLDKFNFYPIQKQQLVDLQAWFKDSKIIAPEMITVDFLTEIMPHSQFSRVEMLYQHSTVIQQSKQALAKWEASGKKNLPKEVQMDAPQKFHLHCDNKGATIIFVKANHGHIFGGFNPLSWVSDFAYTDTKEAYLFSLTDGKKRPPVRLPVRNSKAHFAIKQNDAKYSPAFGEANVSDLFIAFKNLSNSYSMVGNVYKVPPGQDGDTFLAGKKNDWNVDEVEVWSIR